MNILKQTITGMRQQPLLTVLTIVGTALAICLIMIVMMTREVKLVDYANEPNRSRTLYVQSSHEKMLQGQTFNTSIHVKAVNAIFMKMKTPVVIAAYTSGLSLDVEVSGKDNVSEKVKAVSSDFFRVFPLRFIEGKPFTDEECKSNMPVAILSRSACRNMFGQENNLRGKTFLIDSHEYRVAGVVEDVSPLLQSAFSEIWVPVSTIPGGNHPLASIGMDYLKVAILARNKDDFPKIRKEVERNLEVYNKSIVPDTLDLMGAPDEQEVYVNRTLANLYPDMDAIHLRYLLIFAILLIVPAINIASMTQSRLRQREAEIGVRRAFGAKRSTILMQTMTESLIQTIAAGILGLILCFVFCFFLSNYIFTPDQWWMDKQEMSLDFRILFSPEIYGWAFLFCLILNMLSTTFPAWHASRGNIVEVLK